MSFWNFMYPVPAVSRRDEFLTILQLAEDANLLKDVATAAFIPNPAAASLLAYRNTIEQMQERFEKFPMLQIPKGNSCDLSDSSTVLSSVNNLREVLSDLIILYRDNAHVTSSNPEAGKLLKVLENRMRQLPTDPLSVVNKPMVQARFDKIVRDTRVAHFD